MRGSCVLIALALLLLSPAPSSGYRWYRVAVDTTDHPTYEIEFGPDEAYVGTEAGVFRGFGLYDSWEGMGLEYPGLGAYSILYRQGAGWVKEVISEPPLPGATGVAVGDIRDRGYPDIVVAAKEESDRVAWFENPSPSSVNPDWTEHTIDPVADGAREVSLGDLDGDGDLDVAAAIRDEDKIVWYENGLTIPWPRHEVGTLERPRGVFVADINGDLLSDIVAGGMIANTVMWYEAPEDPSDFWVPHCVDDSLPGVKGVFAYDVDGDSDLDIVAAGRDADDVVWYQQGDPHDPLSWTKRFIDDNLPGAVSVWCGDLVGDEKPEVAATAKHEGWVAVYEQPENAGDPWVRTVIDDNLPEACPISAGDFDGDGRTDIVAAGREAGVVAWYRSPPEGVLPWQKFTIDDSAGHSMGVSTGDLDNDGDVDVVATSCDEGLVTVYWNDLRDIYCAFSDGTGLCESDGVYRWHDVTEGWVASWWCPRPFFLREHPLVPGLFFCGNNEGLFASPDLTSWLELGASVLPDTVRCSWFHPTSPNVFMVGTNRGMYRTIDSGLTWTLVNDEVPPLPVMDIEIGEFGPPPPWFLFASLGAGSFSDGVFRSDNEGADWQRIVFMPNPTDLLQDYERSNPTRVVMFLGFAGVGIHRLDHNGFIIGNLNTGLPDLTIHRMRYDPYIDAMAIFGCTQHGLYECMLLEPTGVETEPPAADRLCHVRPNPWREGVAFSLNGLLGGEPVGVRVFDLAGRQVWSWEGTAPANGEVALSWDGRNAAGQPLASGVYFYRVESPDRSYAGKVVRLR